MSISVLPRHKKPMLLPLTHDTLLCTLKGPKGGLHYRFTSVFKFYTEIIMLDILTSMMVRYIM